MNRPLLMLTASAFLLAGTMGAAQAQTTGGGETMQGQSTMQQGERGERRMHRDRDDKKKYGKHRDRRSGMRHHRRGHGMGYGRGMGMHGMGGMGGMDRGMGHGTMMQVLYAVMDANGDGALSLDEVQEAHARIFAHMDANNDDQVTKDEIKAFFRGGRDGKRGRRMGDTRDGSDMSDGSDDMNLSDDVGDDDDN